MHTICVDFGTSSIRAALMKDRSYAPRPLAIAPRSPIDNASIPSAIYIPSTGHEMVFGVDALEKGLGSKKALLLEFSPKSWLTPGEFADIDAPAADGLSFTRRQVIAGLLSLAFKASLHAASSLGADDGNSAFRISHPVWAQEHGRMLSRIYESLRQAAMGEDARKIKPTMTFAEFERWCNRVSLVDMAPAGEIEIEEPVAATLELFREIEPNSRTAALVVDVGAGTIDLGLFTSIVPDSDSSVRRKLIALTPPRSLFGAGDLIDQELLSMVGARLEDSGQGQLAALANNIRFRKEQLFDSGRLAFRGVVVTIDELTRSQPLKQMAQGLKEAITDLLVHAKPHIEQQMRVSHHPLERLDVIFAGGGANLEFLQNVTRPAIRASGINLRTSSHTAVTPDGFQVEASIARMAVAMGGTVRESEWPERKWPEPTFRGLSSRARKGR